MKHKLKTLALALALCGAVMTVPVTGCKAPSAQQVTYKTLASIGAGVDASVKAYFDGVVHGSIKTNGVPNVAKAYSNFQLAYGAAVTLAQAQGTNAIVTANVATAAAAVTAAIAAGR